jgi:hypothetical protein
MHCLLTLAIIAAGVVWLDNNAMGRLFPNDFYCAVGAGYYILAPQGGPPIQHCQHTSLWEGWMRRWRGERPEGR